MEKALRISPFSSGVRYFLFCSGVPNRASTSTHHELVPIVLLHLPMLPVSGAEQFVACGAIICECPMTSAMIAYWDMISDRHRLADQSWSTHLEIGQPSTMSSGHNLEVPSAQPQIPQSQILCTGLERLEDSRRAFPSFRRISGDLRTEQVLTRENVGFEECDEG